ncbi:protein LNK1-like isoform X2 [Lycium barbarum]|uniref:protein LNK1-like isoform X2 n=1 Tax=Lycium barbarum TaxID=112863 RepID=UPI00293E4CD7|nr:protein LNK1-like isoform X2 [Lycium barbarum]
MHLIMCFLIPVTDENNGILHHCFKRKNMDSIDSEFCQNGSFLGNKKAAVGENSCSFPLGPSSLADDDLSFFDNNCVEEDTNDLLCYSWSEIGNFEDVDMMFSCDSTFGLGDGNENDLGWFSSSDAIKGFGGGFSDFKFQNPASNALENISGRLEVSRTKETGSSVSDSGTKNQSASDNMWPSQKDESAILSHLPFVNGSSNSESNLAPQKKININTNNGKHQNQLEGKRKGTYIEKGDALHKIDGLSAEKKYSTEATEPNVNLISSGSQQKNEAYEPETDYFNSSFPYMSDYSSSDQTALHPTSSITKSGNDGFMSLSPKDISASNHLHSMQHFPDPSFQMDTTSEKKAEKLLHHFGNNSDLEGISMRLPAELDSSIVLESTSISSRLDEVAEEAAGFHQLQCVTERLDIRTKLCIRDSLYRLARSAELRHRDASNDSGDDRDRSQALISERTNKVKGYMDMERDTNPIDRSIAHLLFLRSSGSYVAPGCDSLA